MKQQAHSPLPWRVVVPPPTALDVQAYVVDRFGQNVLCRVAGLRDEERAEPRRNAEFVVRACNSYEAMLVALKVAESYIHDAAIVEHGHPASEIVVCKAPTCSTLKQIQDAIALAEGQK